MTTDEGFRDEIRAVIRRHDPDADELRGLASDLKTLASRYDDQAEVV